MNFSWRRTKTDERITNSLNKVYKEAYYVVMLICFISLAVKVYLYGYDIKFIALEVLIIIIPSLFFNVRTVWLGLYSDEVEIHDRTSKIPMSAKSIVIGVGFGVAMALFFGIRSSILYASNNSQRVWYFITVFLVSLIIYCPFFIAVTAIPNFVASKVSKKINSKNEK